MNASPTTSESSSTDRRLTLDDIADLRAYEHERDDRRTRIIDLKRRRRVGVGPLISVVFENRETVRFQVQEMVRAERMVSDAQIQAELDTYNPLIPLPGELSATVFIELTDDEQLREWLPKLVGIEHHFELRLGADRAAGEPSSGAEAVVDTVVGEPDAAHDEALTRSDVTSTVHYVRFRLTAEQVAHFGSGPVWLASVHPDYPALSQLSPQTRDELLQDLGD
jgi:hypothetical protein